MAGNGSAADIVLGSGSSIVTRGGDVYLNRRVLLGTSGGSTGTVSITTAGSAGTGAITFGSTIDDYSGASVGLALVGGAVSFGDSVGATTPLASLQVTDSAATLGGAIVHATGSETVTGPLTLTTNTTHHLRRRRHQLRRAAEHDRWRLLAVALRRQQQRHGEPRRLRRRIG